MKDSADIRKINLYKIRNILWSGEWKTKQQLAMETGLSVATCNTFLNELSETGEVVSQKIRIHDVGPGALQYRINEEFETILCVWFDRRGGADELTVKVMSMTGNILYEEEKTYEELTPEHLQTAIAKMFDRFSNITSIMVGTPSIAESGVIRYCDIPALEGYSIVEALTQQFCVPVHLENDMNFKVFGYAGQYGSDTGVVTLANFPKGVLPGTTTVHDGTVVRGHNQFAGMIGFLPYDMSREELIEILQPETCRAVVVKAIASLIAVLNPGKIVLTGDLLDETCPEWPRKECFKWIPESYMPELIYQKDMDDYYLAGMYWRALELKGAV